MATYRDLCKDALVSSTVIAALETPTANEINYALKQLNSYLASFAIRANMPAKKLIINGTSDVNGELSIARVQGTPGVSKVVGSLGRITKVINQNNISLNFTDYSTYIDAVLNNPNHTFYTTQAGITDEMIVYSAPASVIKVIGDKGHFNHALDDTFDYPDYYYGVFEYGLASIICTGFKVAPEVKAGVMDIYKSRLSDVESFNVQMSPLNQGASRDGNFANGYNMQ